MEKRINVGILCYDLQNFTADFINRLNDEIKDFANVTAYPVLDNIGDIDINFQYSKGESIVTHTVKTFGGDNNKTPEGLLLTPNRRNAIECAKKSDVILHYGVHSTTALICSILSFLLRKKQVSINQTLPVEYEIKRRWWVVFSKYFFYRLCYIHVAQSKATLTTLTSLYKISKNKICYIPFEAGIHEYFNKSKKYNLKRIRNSPDTINFLFVGNLVRFKGIIDLIHAFSIIKKETDLNIYLRIIGTESHDVKEPRIKDLESLVQSLDLSNNVRIIGPRFAEELAMEYCNADVFILPTLRDMFPKVFVEAGVYGLPMITSDASGAVDTLIVNNLNGFVYKAGSFNELVDSIIRISNGELLEKLRTETRKLVDNYLIETSNEAQLFAELIKNLY